MPRSVPPYHCPAGSSGCPRIQANTGATVSFQNATLASVSLTVRPSASRPSSWPAISLGRSLLAVLRRGLWEERRVQVCYRGRPLRLAPLGLVAKGTTWYLVAARDDGEIRTYRVPKITSAVAAGQALERPPGFDLAAHWASACDRGLATRPVYPVRLRVRTPAVHRLSWAPGTTVTQVARRADGWSDVTMTFENAFEAATFLLGMAGEAVVVSPDELRDRIRTAADRLALLHADETGEALWRGAAQTAEVDASDARL